MKAFLQQPITWVAFVAVAFTAYLVGTNHVALEQAPSTFALIAGPLAVFLGLQAHGQAMAAGATSTAGALPVSGALLEATSSTPATVVNVHAPAPASSAPLTDSELAQLRALLPPKAPGASS